MIESWNEIVHIAMIGTDKRQLNETSLPAPLKEYATVIKETNKDKEELYLSQAAFIYNFRQCGFIPIINKEAGITRADKELQEYANRDAHQVLHAILDEDCSSLIAVWLQWCQHANRIVQPEILPSLFELAVKNKYLQPLVMHCAGKRGEWLASLNEFWKFNSAQLSEDIWLTGTLEERKLVLQHTRRKDPSKGREMLQSVWAQENASTRSELLKHLQEKLDQDDLPWIENLLQDKSEKVKETAAGLLKQHPSSSIVQNYWQALRQSLKFKEGKKVLGIGSKNSLSVEPVDALDENIFKWGIEKISNEKGFSDSEYMIYQLIKNVPPQFWQEWLHLEISETVSMFRTEKNKKYLSALGLAASSFRNAEWLRAIIGSDKKTLYLTAISVLPQNESEEYILSFLESDETAPKLINELIQRSNAEWSVDITKAIFQYTARYPYQYNNNFYNQNIHHIPIGIIQELEKCTPVGEYNKIVWSKTSDYIKKLLTLKRQTVHAFQSGRPQTNN